MLENIYTTKMSMDKKKLQNRFRKIRSQNGRISKLIALIIFAVILLVIACVSIIIAANVKNNEYTMTGNEFSDYINRPIGAVMADIYYADESKIVFHYGEGFFIIDKQNNNVDSKLSSEFDFVINLKKLNIAYAQQGSSVLDVKISKDGNYAYLSSSGTSEETKNFDEYIIFLDTGFVKKGTIPENTELFTEVADTYASVQNPIGWFSNNCIISNDKIYYLTSETGTVNDIQLITVNKITNKTEKRYLFDSNSEKTHIAYAPDDIKNITDVELVVGGIKYPLSTTNAHADIEKTFSAATKIAIGGTACPFDAELIFTRADGQKGYVTIATDSCAVFKSGDTYYDYGEDNSMLLGYFGLDVDTVIDLTTINKSYMDNSEIVVRNFFTLFDKSDFEEMKTLVTNEFIAQGYIDDAYGMCYGMTRATLETCSKANVDEFLNEYLRLENVQLTLSENDIELLKSKSDEMAVYTVVFTAESNIKGDTKSPYKSFVNVICKRQNNGSWLVHKLER